jgi:hypothetical protein
METSKYQEYFEREVNGCMEVLGRLFCLPPPVRFKNGIRTGDGNQITIEVRKYDNPEGGG